MRILSIAMLVLMTHASASNITYKSIIYPDITVSGVSGFSTPKRTYFMPESWTILARINQITLKMYGVKCMSNNIEAVGLLSPQGYEDVFRTFLNSLDSSKYILKDVTGNQINSMVEARKGKFVYISELSHGRTSNGIPSVSIVSCRIK